MVNPRSQRVRAVRSQCSKVFGGCDPAIYGSILVDPTIALWQTTLLLLGFRRWYVCFCSCLLQMGCFSLGFSILAAEELAEGSWFRMLLPRLVLVLVLGG